MEDQTITKAMGMVEKLLRKFEKDIKFTHSYIKSGESVDVDLKLSFNKGKDSDVDVNISFTKRVLLDPHRDKAELAISKITDRLMKAVSG